MAIVSIATGWNHLMAGMPQGISGSAGVIMAIMVLLIPILLLWLIV
jgi:hypothetical protein